MGFVDVDSHLIESEETWDFLEPHERHFRPRRARFDTAVISGASTQISAGLEVAPTTIWVVDDTWTTVLPGDSNIRQNANVFDPEATRLTAPEKRSADLDALGIDVQLVLSTFFIGVEIDDPLIEAAITRSYNRWAASMTEGHRDRFKWAIRPPLRTLARALEELEFGAAHGSGGIHLRGIEHGMLLSNPYFYPLYERAQDLDLAILVHIGTAHRRAPNMSIGNIVPAPPVIMDHIHKSMAGFHAVVSSDLHVRFPRLRWGFLEAGASWAPAVLQQHRRLVASGSDFLQLKTVTPEVLEEKNIFIACQVDEDIPYLVSVLGENVLCVGTDYAHNDIGSELAAHSMILNGLGLEPSVGRKIVDANGRRLLGIDEIPAASELRSDTPTQLPFVRGAAGSGGRLLASSSFRS